MHVVLERGEESFKVPLVQTTLQNFIAASVSNHLLHLIDRNVAVLVGVGLLAQVFLEGCLITELILQEAVDFQKLAFDRVELVSGNRLRIQHQKVILENVALHQGSKVAPTTTGNAVSRLRDDSLVGLHIVIEASEISCHVTVLDFA